jgi:hypothetical protein
LPMAFFADLTPYAYDRPEPDPNVLNVGWLSAGQPFAKGVPDQRFVEALRKLVARPTMLHRGVHVCEFCLQPTLRQSAAGLKKFLDAPPDTAGNGQIRVRGGQVTYAAPTLILHYVLEHHYAPPEEFIAAVTSSTD